MFRELLWPIAPGDSNRSGKRAGWDPRKTRACLLSVIQNAFRRQRVARIQAGFPSAQSALQDMRSGEMHLHEGFRPLRGPGKMCRRHAHMRFCRPNPCSSARSIFGCVLLRLRLRLRSWTALRAGWRHAETCDPTPIWIRPQLSAGFRPRRHLQSSRPDPRPRMLRPPNARCPRARCASPATAPGFPARRVRPGARNDH